MCYRVRNNDGFQLGITAEGMIRNGGDAAVAGDHTVGCAKHQRIICRLDQAVAVAVIIGVAGFHGDGLQRAAIHPNLGADGGHIGGKVDAAQGGAIGESPVHNGGNAVGNVQGFQRIATGKSIIVDGDQAIGQKHIA